MPYLGYCLFFIYLSTIRKLHRTGREKCFMRYVFGSLYPVETPLGFLTGYLLCLTEETHGNASQCDRPNDRDFSLFVFSKSLMHHQSPCGIKATFDDFWVRFVWKECEPCLHNTIQCAAHRNCP
jgi:hypothetical protein